MYKYSEGSSEQASASKVQAVARGRAARREHDKKQASAVKLQSATRGAHARRHLEDMLLLEENELLQEEQRLDPTGALETSAVRVQAAARGHIARGARGREQAGAAKVQAVYRGNAARREHDERRASAVKVQAATRGAQARQSAQRKLEVRGLDTSAVKMQAAARGRIARGGRREVPAAPQPKLPPPVLVNDVDDAALQTGEHEDGGHVEISVEMQPTTDHVQLSTTPYTPALPHPTGTSGLHASNSLPSYLLGSLPPSREQRCERAATLLREGQRGHDVLLLEMQGQERIDTFLSQQVRPTRLRMRQHVSVYAPAKPLAPLAPSKHSSSRLSATVARPPPPPKKPNTAVSFKQPPPAAGLEGSGRPSHELAMSTSLPELAMARAEAVLSGPLEVSPLFPNCSRRSEVQSRQARRRVNALNDLEHHVAHELEAEANRRLLEHSVRNVLPRLGVPSNVTGGEAAADFEMLRGLEEGPTEEAPKEEVRQRARPEGLTESSSSRMHAPWHAPVPILPSLPPSVEGALASNELLSLQVTDWLGDLPEDDPSTAAFYARSALSRAKSLGTLQGGRVGRFSNDESKIAARLSKPVQKRSHQLALQASESVLLQKRQVHGVKSPNVSSVLQKSHKADRREKVDQATHSDLFQNLHDRMAQQRLHALRKGQARALIAPKKRVGSRYTRSGRIEVEDMEQAVERIETLKGTVASWMERRGGEIERDDRARARAR